MSWILQGNVLCRIKICKSLPKKKSKKPLAKCIPTFKRQIRIWIELLEKLTIKQTNKKDRGTASLEIS